MVSYFVVFELVDCAGSNIICSPVYPGIGGDAHAVCDRSIDVFISYRRSTGSQLARCLALTVLVYVCNVEQLVYRRPS